ncbi:DUF2922 domain-containing protein [Lapidilactobacillus achengensis]|uniref:DUF2922 domain-containing protein n=1 Tax=Lapidilactobacillus achengensis TaxID=2486000 RepID=A0ABW1UQ30_9LACO|nr:DUF2922 domain-containing protein [Lapidilactobacillus achengensis]
MKQLQLNFQSNFDKKHHVTLSDVNTALTGDQVKTQMQAIAASKLFANGDERLYDQPLSAQYVERIVTPIFDEEKDAVEA